MLDDVSRDRDFPSLRGRIYLNTAAEGIPPRAVGEAMARYFDDKLLGMDGRERHAREWEAARAGAGRFLGLCADEVGLCSSSAEAFNLTALALRLQPGDEVVINDLEFPSGATPWLQSACPATVRLWRSRGGALHLEDLAPLLSANTRLVTASLVSYYNGFLLDVPPLLALLRQRSPALFALDVTQALGRIPLPLDGVDLIISSTHKWILAGHGGGIVGVPARRAAEWTVPAGGWFNLENAFAPDRFERAVSRPGAASYMCGMPNYPAIYMLRAALEYIESVGVEAIDRHARPLVAACLEGLRRLPVEVLSPAEPERLAGIVAFRHPDADRIAQALHAKNIHVMNHAGRLRISLHGYNRRADVDALLAGVEAAL